MTRSVLAMLWQRHTLGPLLAWTYQHSLGLALALLFVASFALHLVYSVDAANERAALHGDAQIGLSSYVADPQLWFESLSELAVGVLVDRRVGSSLDISTT